ncbi:MAG: AmmeMemoRadiSam system radical SAM enzyme, partial [Armatimonadota bacterium]
MSQERRRFSRRDFLRTAAGGGTALALGVAAPCTAAWAKIGDVSNHPARFWERGAGTDVVCKLCPRGCTIKVGERGFCGARENVGGKLITLVYGKPCVAFVDPVEKDPFFHLLPAQKTLAVGTACCNLDCAYCQSHEFAQSRPELTDNMNLPPERLVAEAKRSGLKLITFTYSEPIQAIEYVIDTARLAKSQDVHVTVHTAAYINPEPFQEMCRDVLAVNIDLKGFTEDFYAKITGGRLKPVLETIKAARRAGVWLELTNLVLPGHNDRDDMVTEMCKWIVANVGAETPLHVTRFFPKYKMLNTPSTPIDTIVNVRSVAYKAGLRYVYTGN